MLEITYLREHAQAAAAGLKKRGLDAEQSIQDILKLDELRRQNQNELDQALAESNQISKEIGLLYKEGKRDEADKAKARTAELKERIKELQQEQEQLKNSLDQDLVALPNVPIDIVPAGKSEADNEEVKRVGEIKAMPEGAKPHWELAEELKLIRFGDSPQ